MNARRAAAVGLAVLAAAGSFVAYQQTQEGGQRAYLSVLDRLEFRDRVLLDAEPAGPWDGVNDGRHHGFADFGIHAARQPPLDPFMRSGRHLDTVHAATQQGRDGYGVIETETHVTDNQGTITRMVLAAAGEPVLAVRTRTLRHPRGLTVFAQVTFLPAAARWYFKEPKWTAGPFVGRLTTLTVRDRFGRELSRYDLSRFVDPTRHTKQLQQPTRRQVELTMSGNAVRVYASGLRASSQRGEDWHNGPGIDRTRLLLQNAPKYVNAPAAAYCHADTLRATWETVVWADRATLLLNAGTGGVGFHDCLPTYRSGTVLAGKTFRNLLRLEW